MGRLTGWIHNNHFTDNKLNDDHIYDVTVDIGQNKDWSISDFKEVQSATIEGKKYVEEITKQYYNDSKDHNNIQIPAQRMNKIIHLMPCRNNNKQLCWHQSTQL